MSETFQRMRANDGWDPARIAMAGITPQPEMPGPQSPQPELPPSGPEEPHMPAPDPEPLPTPVPGPTDPGLPRPID